VTRRGDKPAFDGEQLVIVSSPFFPHKLVEGYSDPIAHVVKSVNGIPIKNLRHLVEVLRDTKDPFIDLEFSGRDVETLIFPRQAMLDATDEILNDNDIRAQGSPDVLSVWTAQPASDSHPPAHR
jgi:PDZ domain